MKMYEETEVTKAASRTKLVRRALVPLLTAVATAASGAAHAESGLDRCRNGQLADHVEVIPYRGTQSSASFPNIHNPPNVFAPGDAVRVTVTGSVDYKAPFHLVAFAGNGVPAGTSFPFPGLNEVSSVARWNNFPGGWIGEAFHTADLSHCAPAPNLPARLIYFINDSVLWDNGREWTIRTELFRSRP